MKYFAYGSNMSLRRLAFRTPNVEKLGTYRLTGYTLRFHKRSDDGSGKCDAHFTGHADDFILGVLYEINDDEKSVLDRIEGLGKGYDERWVDVVPANGPAEQGEQHAALMYVATDIEPQAIPYSWYKIHVLTGALEAHLPQAYLEAINSVDEKIDENKDRHHKELEIYQ